MLIHLYSYWFQHFFIFGINNLHFTCLYILLDQKLIYTTFILYLDIVSEITWFCKGFFLWPIDLNSKIWVLYVAVTTSYIYWWIRNRTTSKQGSLLLSVWSRVHKIAYGVGGPSEKKCQFSLIYSWKIPTLYQSF